MKKTLELIFECSKVDEQFLKHEFEKCFSMFQSIWLIYGTDRQTDR